MSSLNNTNEGKADFTNDTGQLSHNSLTGEGSSCYGPAAIPRTAQTNQNGPNQLNVNLMFDHVNYEENNNMDENSNDQAYEQYPDYHHQHCLAQQALYSQQQTSRQNEPLNHSLHADNTANNFRASSMDQSSLALPSNTSVMDNNGRSGANDSGYTGDSPSFEQSVRPRIGVPSSNRRMSLTPSATQYEQSSLESPFQTGMYSNWNTPQLAPISDRADHQESLDQCDKASLSDQRQRNNNLRLHRRNSSYDSGMSKHQKQEIHLGQVESIDRRPPLPAHYSSDAGALQPLPPVGVYTALPPRSSNETERVGELLFYNFTQEEFRRERLMLPRDIADHPGLQECNLLRAGSDLRRLADAFAATPAREKVRGMAERVIFSTLTWDNFAGLCMELFRDPQGITSERIVALFTFIADIAKQEIRRGAENCIKKLMAWSLRFIFDKVCLWVQRAGGWGRVLHQGLEVVYKIAMTAAALAVAAALGVYVVRTLRHS